MKELDGRGEPIVDDEMYFVQDARTYVGNCGAWWAVNGAGYVCDIEVAGKYRGKSVRNMRDTEVPWPVDYVLKHTVRHVRVDVQAFNRKDKPLQPDMEIAARKRRRR